MLFFVCELQKIFFLKDMMDNKCANIFSIHAYVYGSHSVKFAFMCILNLVFKFGLCLFIYPHLLNFPQNLFCLSYFYRERNLFLKPNKCS